MTVRIGERPEGSELPAADERLLEARATSLLSALELADSELSITLVDDNEMASLNAGYRGVEGPTDVLSFSLHEGEHAERRGALLGDVVIGLAVAGRQARDRNVSLDDEIARLLIHGVLHLLGHDHQQPEEERRMQAEERRLWEALSA